MGNELDKDIMEGASEALHNFRDRPAKQHVDIPNAYRSRLASRRAPRQMYRLIELVKDPRTLLLERTTGLGQLDISGRARQKLNAKQKF